MPGKNQNLENKINETAKLKFKSEGERRIAYFLDNNSIKYQYEPGILVNTAEEKPRIWYPDFYLPEFGSYVEYYGLVGQKNYDKGIKTKERIYSKMGLDVIPVYPWMFAENWQDYIMKELKRSNIRKFKNLNAKPYWSNQKTGTYNNSMPNHFRNNQSFNKGY
jgi:hypothetical protein